MRMALHTQIFLALLLAAIMGASTGTDATVLGITWLAIYTFVGTLFLSA
jgi:DAACS family dicarboxylate/amino acid:cation (Na+ or H+) symporter